MSSGWAAGTAEWSWKSGAVVAHAGSVSAEQPAHLCLKHSWATNLAWANYFRAQPWRWRHAPLPPSINHVSLLKAWEERTRGEGEANSRVTPEKENNHWMSQINNKAKHSCLLWPVTMAVKVAWFRWLLFRWFIITTEMAVCVCVAMHFQTGSVTGT